MKEFKAKIIDPVGLHARPASLFVQTANKFKSDVTVEYNKKIGNGKSILNLMSLAISCGEVIKVKINGPDEDEACKKISELLKAQKLIA